VNDVLFVSCLMKILVIDNETKNLCQLVEFFGDVDVDVVSVGEKFDREKYDLYVLSGWSHHSVFFEPSPYENEIEFVLSTDKKVIWICLGAQIVAKAFGSVIDKLPNKFRWELEILFDDKKYSVFESHRFSIKKLWKKLIWLAISQYGYEIFRHKNKSIWWFQFHPEKSSDGKILLGWILGK